MGCEIYSGFVRRYPFVLAETGETGQRAVCIDEAYEGFNDDEGEPLFAGEETTPILQQAMDFLEEYQKQYLRTEAFVQRLRENDLLMELNAKVDMVDGQQFGLTGLLAIDEKRFPACFRMCPNDGMLHLIQRLFAGRHLHVFPIRRRSSAWSKRTTRRVDGRQTVQHLLHAG